MELLEARQLVELPEGGQVERAVDPVDLAVAVIASAVRSPSSSMIMPAELLVGLGGDLEPHRLAPLPAP